MDYSGDQNLEEVRPGQDDQYFHSKDQMINIPSPVTSVSAVTVFTALFQPEMQNVRHPGTRCLYLTDPV